MLWVYMTGTYGVECVALYMMGALGQVEALEPE
jgi:hypothetical protein